MLQTLVNASVSQFSLVCSSLTTEGINLTLADLQKCSIALPWNQNGAQSFAEMHSTRGSKQLCFFGSMLCCCLQV